MTTVILYLKLPVIRIFVELSLCKQGSLKIGLSELAEIKAVSYSSILLL